MLMLKYPVAFFNAESKNDSATNFRQQILIFLSFMNTFKKEISILSLYKTNFFFIQFLLC